MTLLLWMGGWWGAQPSLLVAVRGQGWEQLPGDTLPAGSHWSDCGLFSQGAGAE